MDDAEFYRALSALDRDFADRWKKASGGKLKTWLGPKAIEAMLFPMFKTNKITASQAQALSLLWLWTFERMNKQARADFWTYIAIAYDNDWFFAGSGKQLTTDDELRNFWTATSMASVGKINFVSPKTGLAYKPDLYLAVRLMVVKGMIKVYEVDAAALAARGGVYRSDIDRLVLYKGLDPALALSIIVHETTHTIQDWRDVVSTHKFTEADAYVAQAVSQMSTGKQYFLEYPALEKAGRLVLAGKGVPGNAEWDDKDSGAYAAVVRAVEADPLYADTKNLPWKPSDAEKGKDEAKALSKLLQDIKQAEALADWAADAAKSGYRQVVDGIANSLP
jgi:hypothetical protein